MPIKIFLVEDHAFMREMLSEFLSEHSEFEVSGAASTGEEALERIAETEVDLMLVDVLLPGISGIDVVEELQHQRPGVPCLMLSGHGEGGYVQEALEAGAQGYLLKGDPDEIPEAIQRVIGGEMYLSKLLRGLHVNGKAS